VRRIAGLVAWTAAVAVTASGLVACQGSDGPPVATIGRAGAIPGSLPAATTEPVSVPAAGPGVVPPTSPLPLPLPGCPVPSRPSTGASPPGAWHPPALVPEAELPEALPPPDSRPPVDLAPLEGKGMWLWKFFSSEGGDAAAIVRRARAAGLRQLWVRVGDSRDGFYAAEVLADLVPRAHAAGLAVVGWGFPFLYDPVGDAAWTAEALAWRGPGGEALDGFSPDIEMATEGVQLTERRVRVYLGLVRRAAGDRLVVATVYRPADWLWESGRYPYDVIASYVDAFAPMVYWGCTEPGQAAAQALERLSTLRPVHVVGQGYDMGTEGGRPGAPGIDETVRFLDVSARGGAVGASFWDWQEIGQQQWDALAAFPWGPG
jgi:hypothetical protein